MIRVYHFANWGFGRPFLENYQHLPDALKAALDITLVFALNRKKPKGLWPRIKHQLYRLKTLRAYRREFKQSAVSISVAEDVNDAAFLEKIPEGSIGLCSGFNQIFSPALLDRFKVVVNVHPSVLPFYRGPVPSYWCLENGEKKTGYTLHHMTAKIDDGLILDQGIVPIAEDDTEESLDQKIARAARGKVMDWLAALVAEQDFPKTTIKATAVYLYPINYRSFPPT